MSAAHSIHASFLPRFDYGPAGLPADRVLFIPRDGLYQSCPAGLKGEQDAAVLPAPSARFPCVASDARDLDPVEGGGEEAAPHASVELCEPGVLANQWAERAGRARHHSALGRDMGDGRLETKPTERCADATDSHTEGSARSKPRVAGQFSAELDSRRAQLALPAALR
jgi:hypothetical protein